ncbi:DMT family transporter [Alsobacter sp. SYSU BS001988]|jgi:S-adenosylmethionine uptake transporter
MKPALRHDLSSAPIWMAMAGAILLTVMDAIMKGLSDRFATIDLVAGRYVFGVVWSVPLAFVVRPPWPGAAMLRAHLLRTLVVVLTALCFFYSLSVLSLVEAVVFSYLAPVFMALLGRVMLGEKVAPAVALAIAVSFAGVLVIAAGKGLGVSTLGRDLWGVAAALAAALFYALAMVMLRARTSSDHLVGIVALQNLIAMAYVLPFSLALGDPGALIAAHWPWLLAAGFLGTFGHLCYAGAFKRAPAAKVGTVEYTNFIWASAIGYIAFRELPTWSAAAGAALIVLGSLILFVKRRPAPA